MVSPLPLNKRQQGQVYEVMAEQYLQRHHLKPVERNFTCRSGEIDLIMRDKSCVVFVEVKFRKQNHFGSAAEAVNWRKQQKLKRAALLWLKKIAYRQNIPSFVLMWSQFKAPISRLSGLPIP